VAQAIVERNVSPLYHGLHLREKRFLPLPSPMGEALGCRESWPPTVEVIWDEDSQASAIQSVPEDTAQEPFAAEEIEEELSWKPQVLDALLVCPPRRLNTSGLRASQRIESLAISFGCLTSSLRASTIDLVGYGPWLRATPWQPPQRVGEDRNRGNRRPIKPGLTGGRAWTLDCS
jgi:hypothetical protein